MSPRTNGSTPSIAREVYRQTVGIVDPAQREQQLDELCGENHQLRSKVLNLLASRENAAEGLLARAVGELGGTDTKDEEDSGSLPESLATALDADTCFVDPCARVGQQIGPYQLIEQLGQGGMGTVFLARQTEPVVRDVAVKVIRSDVTSPGIIKRFEAERQILAMMSHPNIAQVFDAGATHDGHPYFVMELVRGVPITKYCQQHAISLEARLHLFIDLCRAIEHAHQKGAVHRDLKPANILVSSEDSRPVVKVIDFGVAKALSTDLNADTPVTHFSQLVGTPLYMAPEQMRMRGEEIDVRSDVYSLGVLLYELLTGDPPYQRAQLQELGLTGFLNLLENQTPPFPSRQSKHLGRQRQRELDWITIKAINPVPQNRYQSAGTLADDLERFLNNETVSAGPPTKLYAVGKWWQRNTSVAGVTSLIVLMLLLVSLISIWQIKNIRTTQRLDLENQQRARDWQETARLQQAVSAFRGTNLDTLRRTIENNSTESQAIVSVASNEGCWLERFLLHAGTPQPNAAFSDSARLGPVAFSSAASRIVAAADDGTVWLYGMRKDGTILPVSKLGSHPDRVESIAISPDGDKAVTGSFSGQVWFWDLEQRRLEKQVAIVDAGIQSLVWSLDGKYVAAGARYELAWVGDENGDEVFRVSNNHRHESVVFSRDSKSLFVPTRQGINEYEVPSGNKIREILTASFKNIRTMCLGGKDLQWLIVGERYDEAIMVIDINTGQSLGTVNINGRYPQELATMGDGNWLSILYPDRRVEFIRLSMGSQATVSGRSHLRFLTTDSQEPIPENAPLSLVWLGAQDRMLVAGGGQAANVWEWKHLMPLQELIPPYPLIAAFPRKDNQLLYLQLNNEPKHQRPIPVSLYDRSEKSLGDPIPFQILSTSQSLSNGLAAVCGPNVIHIVDVDTGATVAILSSPFNVELGATISSDGKTLAVTDGTRIMAWKTEDFWSTHRVVGDFATDASRNIQLLHDGETIICKNFGRLCELSLRTGKLKRSYEQQSEFLSSICLNANEDLMAVAMRAEIEIWDRHTGELTHSFSGVSEVMSMCFAPDERTLLAGNRDGSIRAWHLSTGQSLGVLYQRASASRIEGLQFFPNSTQILAWAMSSDGAEPIVLGQPPRPAPKRIPAPTSIPEER